MRKIYIFICAIAISVSTIAQIATQNMNRVNYSKLANQIEIIDIDEVIVPNSNNASSVINIIWESDFSDPSVWTIGTAGQNPPNYGWSIDAAADGWWSTNGINSTSGGNFAELSNGDPQAGTQVGAVIYTMTTAQPINIFGTIGSADATLSFEEFGARFYDLQEVQVSMDGTNFVTVGDNLSYSQLTSAGGSQYGNPTLREINLAPYLSGTPNSVWIRFSWTSELDLALTDPNYLNTWVAYGWYIDDVKVAESPSNRVTIEDEVIGGYWIDYLNYTGSGLNEMVGLDYSVTPLSQIQNHPFAIEALFRNEGTSEQSVNLAYDVTGAASYSGSSSPELLASGDSIFLGASFSPTAIGSYSIDIWGFADSAGAGIAINQTDVKTREIEVTDYIYGKDLGELNLASSWILGGPGDQWHFTTRYEMYANEQLYSLRTYITDESVVGAEVKAVLYEIDSTDTDDGLLLLAESDNYIITAQDLGAWVDIMFPVPIDLYSNYAYEFGIAGFLHPTDSVFVGTSGESMYNGEHSLFDEVGLNPNDPVNTGTPTWYYITRTPMVRMNFNPSTTISTFDIKEPRFNIYPNPTNGKFSIKLDVDIKYDIVVKNTLGQTVLITDIDGVSTIINLSDFDKGVYTIELRNSDKTYIEKVIVD